MHTQANASPSLRYQVPPARVPRSVTTVTGLAGEVMASAIHVAVAIAGRQYAERRNQGHEQEDAPAAGPLRPVHRRVGVADQVLADLVGAGAQGDADARAGRRVAVRQLEWRAEQLQHALGHGDRVLLVGDVLAQDRELVATEAGDRLVPAQRVAQPLGDRQDQLVAGRMAEAVVDDLEAVEVEEQHRDMAAGATRQAVERRGSGG